MLEQKLSGSQLCTRRSLHIPELGADRAVEKPLGSWEKAERVFCKGREVGFPAGMTQSE